MESQPLDQSLPSNPNVEILRPSKGKYAIALLVGVVLLCEGLFLVHGAHSSLDRLLGYLCCSFFGLVILVSLVSLVPGASFLRIGSDGLTVRTMGRTNSFRWSDIDRFGLVERTTSNRGRTQSRQFVGFDFSATYPRRDKGQKLRSIHRKQAGYDATLPDNYGWDCAELAAHLNQLREHHLSSAKQT